MITYSSRNNLYSNTTYSQAAEENVAILVINTQSVNQMGVLYSWVGSMTGALIYVFGIIPQDPVYGGNLEQVISQLDAGTAIPITLVSHTVTVGQTNQFFEITTSMPYIVISVETPIGVTITDVDLKVSYTAKSYG